MTPRGLDKRRQLVLVRHAKSSWEDPAVADHDRPLANRGRKALGRMSAHLEDEHIRPDVVLCSSARRTRETLDGIRPSLGKHVRIEIENGLYDAGLDDLLTRLQTIDDSTRSVLVIGHNPGLAELVELLSAHDPAPSDPHEVPTGAIAVFTFAGPWSRLGAAVVSHDSMWRPRPPR